MEVQIPCPACGEPSFYHHDPGRFYHLFKPDHTQCWADIDSASLYLSHELADLKEELSRSASCS